MTLSSLRRVALIGGTRIPFCRANTGYADLSNLDMLSAAIQGLCDRFQLGHSTVDEVVAGAVTHHSKDWNLAREAVLSTKLNPDTPGVTLQQACGTSLQAALMLGAKIATRQIDCAIAAGVDTASDVPIVFSQRFAKRLMKFAHARNVKQRLLALKGLSPRELIPVPPSPAEPRTGLSMGQHCELMAQEWGIGREAQDEFAVASHHKAAAAVEEGFFDDLLVPCEGMVRDNNVRKDTSVEALASLRTAFDRTQRGTLTAGNSTPLTDGAAAVLLASEEWARDRELPVQAFITASRTAAVDYVGGEGLLMAPTVAVSELLERAGIGLQEFDFYEIHEAFAAQVLCTLEAWKSEAYCRDRLNRSNALGEIDPNRINVKGSSLAFGHPFAATGARIVANLGKIVDQAGGGRGLISVCTAGGMGLAAILERY